MKRQTALNYSREIARRLHSINGIFATPLCEHEAVRVSRVWVFGSTAKGSQRPNDLDVMFEMKECGRQRSWEQGALDRDYFKRYGIRCAKSSKSEFRKWITKGMKLVSRHDRSEDQVALDVKKLIYPRYEMDQA